MVLDSVQKNILLELQPQLQSLVTFLDQIVDDSGQVESCLNEVTQATGTVTFNLDTLDKNHCQFADYIARLIPIFNDLICTWVAFEQSAQIVGFS